MYSYDDPELNVISRKNNENLNKKLYNIRRPEVLIAKRNKYYLKNKESLNKTNVEFKKKYKAELRDSYIKKTLTDGTDLTYQDLTPELINLKRIELKLRNYGQRN